MAGAASQGDRRAEAFERFGQGRWAEALAAAEGLPTGGDPDLGNLVAVAHFQSGRPEPALKILGALVAAHPDHAQSHNNLATMLQAGGREEEAEGHYERALALSPDLGEARRNLGALLLRRGAGARAAEHLRRAAHLLPGDPRAQVYLGQALSALGQPEEAMEAYRAGLRLAPGLALARAELAMLLQHCGRAEEALETARQAAAAAPRNAEVLHRLACLLQIQGLSQPAREAFQRVLQLEPSHREGRYNLAMLLKAAGEREAAYRELRTILAQWPEAASARHMLDALQGHTTARAPEAHIREIFDSYAGGFETHLLDRLGYRAPQEVLRLTRTLAPGRHFSQGLDLGCGTGLMARNFAPLCAAFDGIDLSAKMVASARAGGLYRNVWEGEVATLLQRSAGGYDLALAGDLFIYIGDLAPVFSGLARVLKAGGLFAFSVETLEAGERGDYRLRTSGRYAQSLAYLESLGCGQGFELIGTQAFALRREFEREIPGLALLMEKSC